MMHPKNSLFKDFNEDFSSYCGIDEAGRGSLAGPLVFAGVILTKKIDNLADSKKLTQKQRQELDKEIKKNSRYFIYEVSAQKIDKFGLSHAIKESLEAIKDFFGDEKFIFDGNSSYGVTDIYTLVKADSKIASVSAASILAKVHRDKIMEQMAKKYPCYNFEKNKGYGTKEHILAIKKHGYCKIHRQSYKIKTINSHKKALF